MLSRPPTLTRTMSRCPGQPRCCPLSGRAVPDLSAQVDVVPPSSLRKTCPPVVPAYTRLEFEGATAIG